MQAQDHKGSPRPEGLAERRQPHLDAASSAAGALGWSTVAGQGQSEDVCCQHQTALAWSRGFFGLFGFSNLGTLKKKLTFH